MIKVLSSARYGLYKCQVTGTLTLGWIFLTFSAHLLYSALSFILDLHQK